MAKSDYIQNGLQLPKEKKNLEIMLRDVQLKEFFDHELNYRLRKQEAIDELKRNLQSQLVKHRHSSSDSDTSPLTYNPLVEGTLTGLYPQRFLALLSD